MQIITTPSSDQLQAFHLGKLTLRALLLDGEPWFVLSDLVKALELTSTSRVAERLRQKGVSKTHALTNGGRQQVTIIDEGNLYRVIMRSNSPVAERFESWVTDEVLPAIRKTGSYQVQKNDDALVFQAFQILQARKEKAEAELAIAKPKAQAFEDFLGAEGSYSVGDAAKILQKAGIVTGPKRLFDYLDAQKWTYRRAGERHIMQQALERGYLVAKAQSYYDENAGVRKAATPQVRVTVKGLNKLRMLLQPPLEDLAELTA